MFKDFQDVKIKSISVKEIANCIDETISHGIFKRDLDDIAHLQNSVKDFIKSIQIFIRQLDQTSIESEKMKQVFSSLIFSDRLANLISPSNNLNIVEQLGKRFNEISIILKEQKQQAE